MSTGALYSAGLLDARDRLAGRPWAVVSPAFDLAFFTLPPLGTALFLAAQGLFPGAAFALSALVWVALRALR